jgi:pimeloyl-ACP methyl ester carboxylesterase
LICLLVPSSHRLTHVVDEWRLCRSNFPRGAGSAAFGLGRIHFAQTYSYRIARLARDFEELLDRFGLDVVDALGWSMGASVLWSYIDSHGTRRLRKLVFVDQPAAVAAVPWMSHEEQVESGAIFDVKGLLDLGAAMSGADGPARRSNGRCSRAIACELGRPKSKLSTSG